jgi:[ribosomal protein S18]-alanine N-acetyltransferase
LKPSVRPEKITSIRRIPLRIRPATAADIPVLIELEQTCETAAHWSQEKYQQMFQPKDDLSARLILVIEEGDQFQGFLVAHHVHPEWELENIVVAPSNRRKGLGTRLLESLMTHARQSNSESVFLEVRESNLAARRLYEHLGLQQMGTRKSYYAHPFEAAILYRIELLNRDS